VCVSKRIKHNIQMNTYTPVFIETLFVIAKMGNSPFPSTDESINKIWYILTMEYYSAGKRRNKIFIYLPT
jgi:hypothetical protein